MPKMECLREGKSTRGLSLPRRAIFFAQAHAVDTVHNWNGSYATIHFDVHLLVAFLAALNCGLWSFVGLYYDPCLRVPALAIGRAEDTRRRKKEIIP